MLKNYNYKLVKLNNIILIILYMLCKKIDSTLFKIIIQY